MINKNPFKKALFSGVATGLIVYAMAAPLVINADVINRVSPTLVKDGKLTVCKLDRSHYEVIKTIKRAVVTGYSSTVGQTDPRPYEPADGSDLRELKDGEWAIATNILPLGTMVRLTVGEKVVIAKVRDRMNAKYNGQKRFDLYFKGDGEVAKKEAIKWGAQVLDIEVLES